MKQENKRTGWIDICKALAIYCMVLGHTGTSQQVSTVIHVFHMPVFFILSGYCFNKKKNSNIMTFVKKKFLTLIVPYFIFGIALFAFWDAALIERNNCILGKWNSCCHYHNYIRINV